MERKIVGILFGGKSAEHEISLLSAKNVYDAIDREKFKPVLIGIDKTGRWLLNDAENYLINADNPALISLNPNGELIAMQPEKRKLLAEQNHPIFDEAEEKLYDDMTIPEDERGRRFVPLSLDVVFPILHGPFGEDGTVQGFLKLADIPFVGAGVLGSAVGMDKDVMKRLLRDAQIPIGKFLTVKSHEKPPSFYQVVSELGSPVFVKPANMGSSVGISKADSEQEYIDAVKNAFQYDTKIIVEEYIPGREIECAVLGNEEPIASVPGEIIPTGDFYSYNAKYIDEHGAALEIPAKLDGETTRKVQETAIKVFETLSCEGLARVDFFLKDDGGLFVNEINTIPGFTKISMYPKMFETSGISYTELITRLIGLAITRHEKERRLKTSLA